MCEFDDFLNDIQQEMQETADDMTAISNMLEVAQKHGLSVEVVHSFGLTIQSGYPIGAATSIALLEWDI